jgi:error-prone DNA polymerase
MGWDNPPVPWREFERRLSWRHVGKPAPGRGEGAGADSEGAGADSERAEADGQGTGADGEGAGADGEGQRQRKRQDPHGARPVTKLPGNPRRIPWAELHCHSSFSFLDGASDPSALIREAARLGLSAIAITDHDGMYGVPQFAQAATRFKSSDEGLGSDLATVFGAELSLDIPAATVRAPSTGRVASTGRAPSFRIRLGGTCSSWPAIPTATGGCAR